MHLTRSQWAVVTALTLIVAATFVSATVLHHRIEHPTSGSLGLHNLNQPVRTVVIASDWDVNMFIGRESQRHGVAPNQPIREGGFLDTITNRSVEIYCPTGTDGLFERYVAQRGDTLFFQELDTFCPLRVRLNLPPSDSLTIISQGRVNVNNFSEALDELPVAEARVHLSGTAFLGWHGTEVRTMTVAASDHARLNYIPHSGGDANLAQELIVTAADRSIVRVSGLSLGPGQVDITLADEAALVYDDHYTSTSVGTIAHD